MNELRFCSYLLVSLIAGVVIHDSFWILEDTKGNNMKSVYNKWCLCRTNFSCNNDNGSIKFYAHFVSITKLQGFNGDQQTNYLQSEMYLKASAADFKWHTHTK